MTNSKSYTATDDPVVNPPEPIKVPLNNLVNRFHNPNRPLWRKFANGGIGGEEFHKILRGKLLNSIHKMRKEDYPPKPTKENSESMEGWAEACAHTKCVNAGNKYWLGLLLTDIVDGRLEAGQGKEEEIEELLNEWY